PRGGGDGRVDGDGPLVVGLGHGVQALLERGAHGADPGVDLQGNLGDGRRFAPVDVGDEVRVEAQAEQVQHGLDGVAGILHEVTVRDDHDVGAVGQVQVEQEPVADV